MVFVSGSKSSLFIGFCRREEQQSTGPVAFALFGLRNFVVMWNLMKCDWMRRKGFAAAISTCKNPLTLSDPKLPTTNRCRCDLPVIDVVPI